MIGYTDIHTQDSPASSSCTHPKSSELQVDNPSLLSVVGDQPATIKQMHPKNWDLAVGWDSQQLNN